MRKLFGAKKKQPPKKTLDDMPNLDNTINVMNQKAKQIEEKINKINADLYKIRQEMKGKGRGATHKRLKNRAMMLLKKRKMYENQLAQLDNQTFAVENIGFMQDSVKTTMVQLNVMKQSTEVLKSQMQEIDMGDVYDIQDEYEDMVEQTNELQESLNMAFGAEGLYDSDELEAELEELDNFDLEEMEAQIPNDVQMESLDVGTEEKAKEVDEFGF